MQLLRLPAVIQRTSLPRSTLYRLCRQGRFPRPTKLSERSSAWSANEVDKWVSDRLAERDVARQEAGARKAFEASWKVRKPAKSTKKNSR